MTSERNPLYIKPKTVDDLRTAIYEAVGKIEMDLVDDILEYVCQNKELLAEWEKDYLV